MMENVLPIYLAPLTIKGLCPSRCFHSMRKLSILRFISIFTAIDIHKIPMQNYDFFTKFRTLYLKPDLH